VTNPRAFVALALFALCHCLSPTVTGASSDSVSPSHETTVNAAALGTPAISVAQFLASAPNPVTNTHPAGWTAAPWKKALQDSSIIDKLLLLGASIIAGFVLLGSWIAVSLLFRSAFPSRLLPRRPLPEDSRP
jgi:hypothetical protein